MADHPPKRQTLPPSQAIPRHRHEKAYAAVVLAGGYDEAGETGRRRLVPGEVAIHEVFGGHRNGVGLRGAVVLNLPANGLSGGFARVADPDALVRLAERDPTAAALMLRESLQPITADLTDWPDDLARALAEEPQVSLADWARTRGLAAETLSRGFQRVFGISPKRFRFELRARRALRGLTDSDAPLAFVALDAGFADQAHMGHAIIEFTGCAPGALRKRAWRTSSLGKTAS